MALTNLKVFASMLATYVKKTMEATARGAMLIRCVNDGVMVAAIFGNDNFIGNVKTRREVELVRQQLTQGSVEELGFGLSPDGSSWTILVRTDNDRYQTLAGRAFHMEMFRIFLEDVVQGAWSRAYGIPLDHSGPLFIQEEQPSR
jgi:hypothetical protein